MKPSAGQIHHGLPICNRYYGLVGGTTLRLKITNNSSTLGMTSKCLMLSCPEMWNF